MECICAFIFASGDFFWMDSQEYGESFGVMVCLSTGGQSLGQRYRSCEHLRNNGNLPPRKIVPISAPIGSFLAVGFINSKRRWRQRARPH